MTVIMMFRFWKLIQLSTTIFFLIAGFHASRHSKQINMINIKSKTVQGIKSRICETKRVDVNMQRLRSEQVFLSKSFHLFFRSFPSVHTHSVAKGGLLIVLSKICRLLFPQKVFYRDVMLAPIRMDTNMAALYQQKQLSLSFATKG